jgi:hypothetical protein
MAPTKNKCKWLALLICVCLSACHSRPQLQDLQPSRRSDFEVGASREVSLGETIGYVLHGHWLKTFRNLNQFQISDLPEIKKGTTWLATYEDAVTHDLLLTNDQFFGSEIALCLGSDGRLSSDPAAVQLGGMKRGRKWTWVDRATSPTFMGVDETPDPRYQDQKGWRLYYIGVSNNVLRLTAEDLGAGGETLGRIEYTHDLNAATDFVFRGVRLRIDERYPDGRVRFTVLEDASL